MKKLALRAYFALALAAVLAIGAFAFTISYFVKADDWVMFSGSPHVYSGANLSVGYVDDRDGTRLLDATDGRTYSDDAQTRAATMHLLGDRYGYIYAPLLGNFADKMIGYDKINGLYTLREEYSTAKLSISAEVQKAALEALNGRRGTIGVSYGDYEHAQWVDHDRLRVLHGPRGLRPALLGQVDVDPAGEQVLRVPFTFAVTKQDQRGISHG